MSSPVNILLREHHQIMAVVQPVKALLPRWRERSGEAPTEVELRSLIDLDRVLEGSLPQHADKEDRVLFPAIEDALGTREGPTAVMRMEHREIHAQAEEVRRTLRDLRELEHPAVDDHGHAFGRELRQSLAEGMISQKLVGTLEALIPLLESHFAKEEQVLFPMAESVLDSETKTRLAAQLEPSEP